MEDPKSLYNYLFNSLFKPEKENSESTRSKNGNFFLVNKIVDKIIDFVRINPYEGIDMNDEEGLRFRKSILKENSNNKTNTDSNSFDFLYFLGVSVIFDLFEGESCDVFSECGND